jgi:hypothetical protein
LLHVQPHGVLTAVDQLILHGLRRIVHRWCIGLASHFYIWACGRLRLQKAAIGMDLAATIQGTGSVHECFRVGVDNDSIWLQEAPLLLNDLPGHRQPVPLLWELRSEFR